MITLARGIIVASGLAAYLRAEIDKRGWSDSFLAEKAGISKSTVSKIFARPHSVPKLETLYGLSQGLGVPLERLIKICGFEPGVDDGMLDVERQAILREAIPELDGILEDLVEMTPGQLAAVVAYIQGQQDQGSRS